MATLIPFPKKTPKSGKAIRSKNSYSVQIRVLRNGKRFTRHKIFRTEAVAKAWAKAAEKFLNQNRRAG